MNKKGIELPKKWIIAAILFVLFAAIVIYVFYLIYVKFRAGIT